MNLRVINLLFARHLALCVSQCARVVEDMYRPVSAEHIIIQLFLRDRQEYIMADTLISCFQNFNSHTMKILKA